MTDGDVQDFFDNDVLVMGKQQIDVNEFKRITSNLTSIYNNNDKVVLFYLYHESDSFQELFDVNDLYLEDIILAL